MFLPDRQKVWRCVSSFRHSTGIGRTDRRTEVVQRYRDLHASMLGDEERKHRDL